MFSADGWAFVDLIALVVLGCSAAYVARASLGASTPRVRGLVTAGGLVLLVGLWALWRAVLSGSGALWPTVILGSACALAVLLATVALTRVADQDGHPAGRSTLESVGLLVVQVVLAGGALVVVAVVLAVAPIDGGGIVFVAAVPVALVVALFLAHRAARRQARKPALLAVFSLALVRLLIAVFVIDGVFTFIGATDRSLGDRLEFQEYGYRVPTSLGGDGRWHDGPWLVLHLDAGLRICSKQDRPHPADDPPVYAPQSVCPAAENLRKTFGDVDIDRLELVRQIEGPAAGIEGRIDLLLWARFAALLVGALALERLLRLAARRQPFARASVLWLRLLAGSAVAVAIVIPLLTDRFIDGLIRRYFNPQAVAGLDDRIAVSGGTVLGVVLLLVLAEIWRYGIRLQEDAEATV